MIQSHPNKGSVGDALSFYRQTGFCTNKPPTVFMVDGTGADKNEEYFEEMGEGFLYKVHMELGSRSRYFRGPATMGTDSGAIVDLLVNTISLHSDPERLFLCGYSRGAMICIEAAHRLRKLNRKVRAMFLLDAVDRSTLNNSETIPDNVQRCYHAVRDPKYGEDLEKSYKDAANQIENVLGPAGFGAAKFLRELAGYVKPMTRDSFGTTPDGGRSVPFGNTGLKIDNPDKKAKCEPSAIGLEQNSSKCLVGRSSNRLDIVKFKTSHGGMGGLPWANSKKIAEPYKNILRDEVVGSEQALDWIRTRMEIEGVFNPDSNAKNIFDINWDRKPAKRYA